MCLGYKLYVDFTAPFRDSEFMELRVLHAAGGYWMFVGARAISIVTLSLYLVRSK